MGRSLAGIIKKKELTGRRGSRGDGGEEAVVSADRKGEARKVKLFS